LNLRHRRLLKLLAEARDYTPLSDLAQRLGCSERTLRNHVRELEGPLRDRYGLILDRRPGRGVALLGDRSQVGRLIRELGGGGDRPLEELDLRVLRFLLSRRVPVTVARLMEATGVGRGTISGALDRAEAWLAGHRIRLVRRPNVGLWIEGEEGALRLALSRLFWLSLGSHGFDDFLRGRVSMEDPIFHPGEMSFLEARVRRALEMAQVRLTGEAVLGLTVHLAVSIKRVRTGGALEICRDEGLEGRREMEAARLMARWVEEGLGVTMPPGEVEYLAMHVMSSRRLGCPGEKELARDAEAVARILLDHFARSLDRRLQEDPQLLADLSGHLSTSINRLRCGFPSSNPILGQIKRAFCYSFEVGLEGAARVQEDMGINLPEDEVGYVVLHVQAALERLRGMEEEVRAAVFCPQGVGILRLMEAKVSSAFPGVRVIGAGSLEDLKVVLEDRVRLVISTVPLPAYLDCQHIVVTPLLRDEEMRSVEDLLLCKVSSSPGRPAGGYPILRSMLSSDLIFLGEDLGDRWDIICFLSARMAETGAVDEDYGGAALERERKSSTCIGGGVAIPHGSPRRVIRDSIALMRPRRPVLWGEEEVRMVFMMALRSSDPGLVRGLFGELARLSEDGQTLRRMMFAGTREEILDSMRGGLN
jgi:activator of the mannose operon (transcriptional antiterminator)